MSVSRNEQSEYVYCKMEELGRLAVEKVAADIKKISHALTTREARNLKKKARDNFLQMIEGEFKLISEQEVAQLLKRSFELKILASPLLEKEITLLQKKYSDGC